MVKAIPRVLLFGSRPVPRNEKAKANDVMEYSIASCVRVCSSFVADNHWSSTENAANTNNAWKLNFNNGNQNNNNKNNNNYVRAFRK